MASIYSIYKVFFDKVPFPVAPEKITIKSKSRNKTIDLINGGEVNAIKDRGLLEISFDLLLPAQPVPFALYQNGKFRPPEYFIKEIEKRHKKPFSLTIIRPGTDSEDEKKAAPKAYQSMQVTLEDYSIKDDTENGPDIVISVDLKEYREYGTTTAVEVTANSKGKITATKKKKSRTKKKKLPAVLIYKTKTSGEKLATIAKKYYGSKYMSQGAKLLFKINKKVLKKKSPQTKTHSKALKKGVKIQVPTTWKALQRMAR